jgi:hypothetical protein
LTAEVCLVNAYKDESHQTDLTLVREAWADWLRSFGWQAFYTQTFSEPVHHPRLAMDRAWRVVRSLSGRYGVGVRAFLVAEEHKLGTYHAHGLVMTFPIPVLELPGSLIFAWQLGIERYGICRFEDIRQVGGVAGYVAKYITKRIADYDFYTQDPPGGMLKDSVDA